MIWNTDSITDQSGRTYLVTGANSGLGFETSDILLSKGATVILGCRSIKKAESAKKSLLQKSHNGVIDTIELDLNDLKKVKTASNKLKSSYSQIDVLINNAGIMAPPYNLTKQGFESQFGVNHLGHMALTIELLPLLENSNDSRVVTVTSAAQYLAKINWDDLQGNKKYDKWACYAQSKLCNVLFALELERIFKLKENSVISLLAHPGIAKTNLQKNSLKHNPSKIDEFLLDLISPFMQSPIMGALPQLFAATNHTVQGGEQYGPKWNFRGYPKLCRVSDYAKNVKSGQKLWEISMKLIEEHI